MGVGSGGRTEYLGQDGGAAFLGVFPLFEDEDSRALAHDETVSIDVEGRERPCC